MLLNKWSAFEKAAIQLYKDSPNKARYCYRWRPDLGLLIIKITDDKKCIKYAVRSAAVLNRFDALTKTLMAEMQNSPLPASTTTSTTTTTNANQQQTTTSSSAQNSAQSSAQAGDNKKTPEQGKRKKKGKKK